MLNRKSFAGLTFCVVLIGLLFLTACGGGGGEGGGEPVTILDVGMTEHTFTPNEFTVPAGAEITINLKNSGKDGHEFRILVFGAKVAEEMQDGKSTRFWSAILLPGESKSYTVTAPSKPGSYVIECSLPGHTDAGMVGTLWVKSTEALR